MECESKLCAPKRGALLSLCVGVVAFGSCSDNGRNTGAGAGNADCLTKCQADPAESARQVCGTDKITYGSCQWLCTATPAGVAVLPGACQGDGSPAADAPPYPADGVHVCDWFKIGGHWHAVECAGDGMVGPVGTGLGSGMTGMMMNLDLPPEVDHRGRFFGTIEDQGAAGTCTAFATTGAMEGALGAMGIQSDLSEMHLWSRYFAGNMDKAIEAARRGGIASAATAQMKGAPYDAMLAASWEKMIGQPDGALVQSLDGEGKFEVTTVTPIVPPQGQQTPSVEQIQRVVAEGKDVVTAFFTGCQWPSTGNDGVIPDYAFNGKGGHAVLVVGYRQINGQPHFIIRNSWGAAWADGGYGYLSFATAAKVVYSAFTVGVRASGGVSTAPNCPDGQAAGIDGVCRLFCQDGSLADDMGQCTTPAGNCPMGMVADESGSCVAACPTRETSGQGWKVTCGEAGCTWIVDDAVAGCAGGPCAAFCPAPTCLLATDPDDKGGVTWSCAIPD